MATDPTEPATIIGTIRDLVNKRNRIPAFQIKAALLDSPVRSKLEESDKGFHNGMTRLRERGEIVHHKGWIYSKLAFERHMNSVNSGIVEDDEISPPPRPSPMADTILEYVENNPGVKSREVIDYLKEHPQFGTLVSSNTSNGYNVINRLLGRKQLHKKEDLSLFTSMQIAKELL